jgi:hypothetical protein
LHSFASNDYDRVRLTINLIDMNRQDRMNRVGPITASWGRWTFWALLVTLVWAGNSRADYRHKILRLEGLPTLDGTPPDPTPVMIDEKGMIVGDSRRTRNYQGEGIRDDAVRWDPGSVNPVALYDGPSKAAGSDATGAIYGNIGLRPVRWPAGSTQPQFLPVFPAQSGDPPASRIYTVGGDGTAVGETS